MTEREACERIVDDGDCVGVLCGDCPLVEGEWVCYNMDEVSLAKMWLRLHPCEKKPMFSREKYLSMMDESAPNNAKLRREYEWPFECEGKTMEECNALGYVIKPEWMEER